MVTLVPPATGPYSGRTVVTSFVVVSASNVGRVTPAHTYTISAAILSRDRRATELRSKSHDKIAGVASVLGSAATTTAGMFSQYASPYN